jgi:hypothetical protein
MRIALATESSSVRRTLEAILRAAGHALAAEKEPAELVLCDTQHLPTHIPEGARLMLVPSVAANEGELSCPLRPHQLVQKLIARSQSQILTLANGWVLDSLARSLNHAETPAVALTEKESQLLKTLIETQGTALPREELLSRVWGMTGQVDTHTLETHIYRLRAKIEAVSPLIGDIVTEGGAYRWVSKN